MFQRQLNERGKLYSDRQGKGSRIGTNKQINARSIRETPEARVGNVFSKQREIFPAFVLRINVEKRCCVQKL